MIGNASPVNIAQPAKSAAIDNVSVRQTFLGLWSKDCVGNGEWDNIPSIARHIIAERAGVVAGRADIMSLLAPARVFEDPADLFDLGDWSVEATVYQIG